jgi:AcrR family transcriptional regulator
MSNNYNDSQNRLTKESIFTALMILMEQKHFQDISITEITKKAGVSRMAFYRNYHIKEDILTVYMDEIFQEFSQKLLHHDPLAIYENLYAYFSSFRKHKTLISNLIRSDLMTMLFERCIEYFNTLSQAIPCNTSYSAEEQHFWIQYIVGGLFNILLEWAKTGMQQSDDYMAKMASEFIQKC